VTPALGARLELELVDPKRNARRSYGLEVLEDPQLPLFPGETRGVLLVLAWGRIGCARRRVARVRFARLEELAAAWDAVLRRRVAHGYVAMGSPFSSSP
jgi:predicted DNA-binding WGR domain protein